MGGIRIENDVFEIAARIKSIDSDYYIIYNVKKRNYELHCARCKPTLQLIIPFSALDKRTLDYVLKTRIAKVIDEVYALDNYNSAVENKRIAEAIDKSKYMAKHLTEYLRKGGSEIPSNSDI